MASIEERIQRIRSVGYMGYWQSNVRLAILLMDGDAAAHCEHLAALIAEAQDHRRELGKRIEALEAELQKELERLGVNEPTRPLGDQIAAAANGRS